MIHYIRDNRNQTMVDVEVYVDENENVNINSTIIIEPYSKFLVDNLHDDLKIIRDFDRLQSLSGFVQNSLNNPTKEEANELVRNILTTVANEYNLYYVED